MGRILRAWSLRSRLVLICLLAVATGLVFGATAIAILKDREATLAHADLESADLTRLLEENVQRHIDTVSRSLSIVHEEIERRDMAEMSASAALKARLQRLRPPGVTNVYIFDAAGQAVAAAKGGDLSNLNIADRGFFRAHVGGEEEVIGPVTGGAVTGGDSFTLSHRLTAADGSFGGVLLATIPVKVFESLYANLDLGASSLLGLYRFDGGIVVRYPFSEQVPSRSITGWQEFWSRVENGPVGVFEAVSPVDHRNRRFSYRVLRRLPLVAMAGLAVEDVLADWRSRSIHAALVAGLAWLVLCGLTHMAWRHLQRAERARDSLEDEVASRTKDLRQARDELRTARDAAEEANRAKSRFLAAASHDLRQPFQAMTLFHTILMDRLADPQDRQVAGKMGEALGAGVALLDALLDVSMLDAGILAVKAEEIVLGDALSGLMAELVPQAQQLGVELRMVHSSMAVRTDRVLLLRAVRNLLVNALRYTPQGRVLVGCRRVGATARVEVWDTGIGIAADEQKAVFEDFYQIGNSERDRRRGLGLGLSVVRRTAALLGLGVGVRSVPGRGSVFSLTVPLVRPQRAKARQAMSRRQKPSGQSRESTAA